MRIARIMLEIQVPSEDDHMAVENVIRESLETGYFPTSYTVENVEEVLR